MRKMPFILTAMILAVISALAWQAFPVRESRAMPTVRRAQAPKVSIARPQNGDTVPERPYVAGKVSNPKAAVWVIIHPMEVSDYWVQPQLTVNPDGTWRVSIYVGRPGNVDAGKRYEIMAIANPKRPLKEGDVMRYWPDAESKSEVVEVVRK
jgi:hypothetical protein